MAEKIAKKEKLEVQNSNHQKRWSGGIHISKPIEYISHSSITLRLLVFIWIRLMWISSETPRYAKRYPLGRRKTQTKALAACNAHQDASFEFASF